MSGAPPRCAGAAPRPAGVALGGIYHGPHHPEAALAQGRLDGAFTSLLACAKAVLR